MDQTKDKEKDLREIRKGNEKREKPILVVKSEEMAKLERVCVVLEEAAYDILRGSVASLDPTVADQLKQQGMAVFRARGIVEGCLKFHRKWVELARKKKGAGRTGESEVRPAAEKRGGKE